MITDDKTAVVTPEEFAALPTEIPRGGMEVGQRWRDMHGLIPDRHTLWEVVECNPRKMGHVDLKRRELLVVGP